MNRFIRNIFWATLILVVAIGSLYLSPAKYLGVIKGHPQIIEKKAGVYYCPMHPHYTSDKPGNCPICGMTLVKKEDPAAGAAIHKHSSSAAETKGAEKKILYWTDTMIPGYKASGPGKSPMGMDLTPVYEEERTEAAGTSIEGYASVPLTYVKQQLIGVKTVTAVKKNLVKTVRVPGYVAHDLELYEAQLNYVKAWREFYVQYVRKSVREETTESWRNYYITPSERARPRSAEFLEAQKKLIEIEYELRHMGLNDAQLDQLTKIKYGQPWVQPELLFFHQGQPFLVYAQIFEDDIGYIDVGQKATIEIPAYHEIYEGIVRSVAGAIDPATRTARVIIEIVKLRSELKADMLVNVTFPIELNSGVIVPREAVMDTGTRKIVFVEKSSGVFEPRDVELNAISGDETMIDKGVSEGERVVVGGNFLIDSESRLRSALENTSSAGGADHE